MSAQLTKGFKDADNVVCRIHPYWCPGRIPQDMNWSDKKRLRGRYDALVRETGMRGFAGLGGTVYDSDPDGLLMNPRKRRRARVLKRMRRADKLERSDLRDTLRTVWGIEANPRQRSSSTTIGDDMSDTQEPRGIQSTAVSRTGIHTNGWSLMPKAKIEDVEGPEVIDDEDDDVVERFIAEVEGAAGTREDPVELD